jgi:phage/plasmid-like protein (TIGR03299 family)
MAHNLYTLSNGASAYVGRQSAWHQLGTVTGEHFSWQDQEQAAGLNFTVEKRQLEYMGSSVDAWGTFRVDYDQATRVKSHTFLGAVGEDYQVIQHGEGFKMLDSLVGAAGGAHYETAGALGKGETIWGLVDLNIGLSVGDDRHESYLLFSTSHDGSKSHGYGLTDTRVVCQNTLNMALSSKAASSLRVRHTRNAMDRIQSMHTALEGITNDVRTMEQKLNMLAQRRVTKESCEQIFARLFPPTLIDGKPKEDSTRRQNQIAAILERFESNDNNAFPEQRGTAYNLLNGITEYVDHYRDGVRGGKRAEAAMFGSGNQLKTNALEIIMASANGMPAKVQTIYTAPKPVATETSLLDSIVEDFG